MAHLGSFAASVDLPEAMRPWSASGMEFLFVPGGITEPAAIEEPLSPRPPLATSSGTASAPSVPQAGMGVAVPASVPDPAQQRVLPRWPEPWRSLAGRVKGTPQVVITYLDLALDLSGTPHPGRRKLFRDILSYAAWPVGTSLFWPLASLKDGKPVYSPTLFTAGVEHFSIATVLCFGTDAYELVGNLLGQGRDHDAITVKAYPHPSELVNLLPHELHLALRDIKALGLK